MFGWFSAFREHGAPTFYGENRTPVTVDTHIVGLLSLFLIPSLAFILILPGIRRHRLSSATSFLISMFIGATLLVSLYHPCWHKGDARILSPYKSFSDDKMDAHITVRVGLHYLNISLIANTNHVMKDPDVRCSLKYNERFGFTEVTRMESELNLALRKGLPFPILKVIEYLSSEGFGWGRQYRVAGHYTAAMLWLAFSSWLLSFFCLAFLPHCFAKCTLCTGILIGIGDVIFYTQIPRKMSIRFTSLDGWTLLQFRPSICFHATCLAAVICVIMGSGLWWLDARRIYHFDTIFSARRHAADSVVDEYRGTPRMSDLLSFDYHQNLNLDDISIRKR